MSYFVKEEKQEYETIPNADVKQEFMDVNVNYQHRERNESYWQRKCEVLERKVIRIERENAGLKAKMAASQKPSAPYSDPLLKAFFCPKLPEEELVGLRREKKELIAKIAAMKNENIQLSSTIEAVSKRFNVENNQLNPEPNINEIANMKKQLEIEQSQKTKLQKGFETIRTQLVAQIQNREAQLQALKNSQPKKTKNNGKKTKATKKLEKKVENLKAEVAKLKISQSINGGCGPKDQKLKSKNRLLGGEVSGLKTQVNNLQSRIVTLTDGLKCLLGDIPSKLSLKFDAPATVPGLLKTYTGDYELLSFSDSVIRMFAGGPSEKYTLVYKLTKVNKLVFLMFCLTTKTWIIKADQENKQLQTMMSSPIRAMENYCNPLQTNRCHWQNNLTPTQFVVLVDNIAIPDTNF